MDTALGGSKMRLREASVDLVVGTQLEGILGGEQKCNFCMGCGFFSANDFSHT